MKTEAHPGRITALRVADAMHLGVFTCDRDALLSEVAATMAREIVHCVVVENGSGETGPPWGVVSDLDLVAAATVRDLDEQTAAGSAATPVVVVAPSETLESGRPADDGARHVAPDRRRPGAPPARRRALDARHRREPHERRRADDHQRRHEASSTVSSAASTAPTPDSSRRGWPALVTDPDGSLTLVSANDSSIAVHAGWGMTQVLEELAAEAAAALERGRRRRGPLHELEGSMVEGDPLHSLLAEIERRDATTVVVGSHGQSRALGIALGVGRDLPSARGALLAS